MSQKLAIISLIMLTHVAQAGVVIGPDGKVSTVITNNDHPQNCEPSREQVMLDRIAILQKAEHSSDPDILAMAEQVRADIAKDKQNAQERQNNPAVYWLKKLVPIFAFLVVLGGVLWAVFWVIEKRTPVK